MAIATTFSLTVSSTVHARTIAPAAFQSFRLEQEVQPEQRFSSEETFELALRFRPRSRASWRSRGAPRWSIGGAARGGCSTDESPLLPLMPLTHLNDEYPSFSGMTMAAHPTFFAYVPQTTARAIEFLLLDEESGEVVYEPEPLPLSGNPQVVSFRYDPNLPPLEVDRPYTWFFTVVCNGDTFDRPDLIDASGNPYIKGWVQRIPPDESLSTALAAAPLRDRPALYAEAGVWLDTLTALAQLRCTAPNDAAIAQDWADLMRSLDLRLVPQLSMQVTRDHLNTAPIAQCSALN